MASSVVEAASPPPPRQSTTSPDRRSSQHSPLAHARTQSVSETTEKAENDDLDPAAFLKSVRELSEKREREDNERYRKLEEEIEKGRQERLARRAERAKSISPQKQQQPETPTPALQTNDSVNTPSSTLAAFGSPAPPSTPPNRSIADSMAQNNASQPGEIPEFKGFGSIKRGSAPSTPGSVRRSVDTSEQAPKPSPSAGMPTRSNTMKWQQRPSSRGGPATRPMSMAAPAHSRDASVEEPQLSRDQIAASLGARDPSYFRQTADRGIGNAAYRKSKDETSGEDDVFAGRRGLPGMSQQGSTEPARAASPAAESVVSETPSRFDSVRESDTASVRSSATPSVADSKPSNDLPLRTFSTTSRSSTITDTTEPSSLSRTPTMSASQARLAGAGERPSSPTKGMGGFVQSALMKRSDSQSKRWSAQPMTGLSRPGSASGTRSGISGLQSSYSMPKLDPINTSSRESSHEPNSRPSSSSSNLASLATRPHDGSSSNRPGMPSRHHSRSKSVASTYSTNADLDGGLTSPMGSPSKRWSPNKSSWIESALAKPDSPKISPTKSSQPSWMENIARAKAQRTSVEAVPTMGSPNPSERSRPGSPTKDTPFGPALLKRSDSRDLRPSAGSPRSVTPPTKTKPASLSSRPTSMLTQESLQISEKLATPTTKYETSNFTQETMAKQPSDDVEADSAPKPLEPREPLVKQPETIPEERSIDSPAEESEPLDAHNDTESVKSPPSTKPKPDAIRNSLEAVQKPAEEKTGSEPTETSKPAPKPTTDFRSNLRSRPMSEVKTQEQPEFMSKFGSLRKAQTEKYVAPDMLKDNITRGKRGLTITGGPQKRERKDELRDSLIAKKDQWKQEKEAGIVHERKISEPPVTASKPEALARRELLGRKESIRAGERSPEKTRNITPEALRFQKSIREKPKAQPPPVAEKPRAVSEISTEEAPSVGSPSPPAQEEPRAEAKEKSASPPPVEEKRVVSPPIAKKRVASPPASAPTSKLAARFNPGLAGLLARGPPSSSNSPSASRSESPVGAETSSRPSQAQAGEPQAQGGPLADARKGRAKGPKKRKAGTTASESKPAQPEAPKEAGEPANASDDAVVASTSPAADKAPTPPLESKPSPAAFESARFGGKGPAPGSAASIMTASLKNAGQRSTPAGPRGPLSNPTPRKISSPKPAVSPKPVFSPQSGVTSPGPDESSPAPPVKDLSFPKRNASDKSTTPPKDDIPEFKGFGSIRRQPTSSAEEDKENTDSNLPSVKDAASSWGMKKSYRPTESPSQIQLPTRKDEEAAMRSASLLASSPAARSPSRPSSSHGLGVGSPLASPSPAVPPKPAKSSRIVSGQLKEASPNKDSQGLGKLPETEAERLLVDSFGSWPTSTGPLTIDTQAVITSCGQPRKRAKTIRKSIQRIESDGSAQHLAPQEEYTLFDESVYVCTHTHTPEGGSKATHVIAWAGSSSTASNVEQATGVAKAEVKREGSHAQLRVNQQGHEQAELFEALGGILVTRRGTREAAPKKFMLCGRKHLGHIAFDEVDFAVTSLCSAFAYLISFPVTLQETKLYLWKGSACSNEEVSAAKLAAMDLSETGEIIEVDQGAEFSSFLNIFGPGTTKTSIPPQAPIWEHKASDPDRFTTRLFSIQQSDSRSGIFSAMFRRPSWGLRSPAPEPGVRAEAKEIAPFTPSDLDAEGIYLLDAYGELHLLPGPLFFSLQPESARNALFSQALLFTSDYAILSASSEDRPAIPKAQVVFAGCPEGVDWLFRGWDGENGLWGLGGLMAGTSVKGRVGEEVKCAGVEELVRAVCR